MDVYVDMSVTWECLIMFLLCGFLCFFIASSGFFVLGNRRFSLRRDFCFVVPFCWTLFRLDVGFRSTHCVSEVADDGDVLGGVRLRLI